MLIIFTFLFRPLLKQIKNSAESHIVLDCTTERIYDVLKQAQQIGMMSDYHSYLITSLVNIIFLPIKSMFIQKSWTAFFLQREIFENIGWTCFKLKSYSEK